MRDIIRKVLLESEYLKLKEYARKTLFKLWDKQKSLGIKPKINSALKHTFKLGEYDLNTILVDWYGGVDKVYSKIKNKLVNKHLTTDDLRNLEINVGGYEFSFRIKEMSLRNTQQGGVEIIAVMKIIDGGVELITTGDWLDLTDIESIDDEIRWEISYEIKDLVKELIDSVAKEYGFGSYLDHITIHI
jgi:hypothetical protein